MENWKIILIACCFILVIINILIGILLIIKHCKDTDKITKERYSVISNFHGYRRKSHFDHIEDEKDKLILQVLDVLEDALLFHEEVYCCYQGRYIDILSESKKVVYGDYFFYIMQSDYELYKKLFELIKGDTLSE